MGSNGLMNILQIASDITPHVHLPNPIVAPPNYVNYGSNLVDTKTREWVQHVQRQLVTSSGREIHTNYLNLQTETLGN